MQKAAHDWKEAEMFAKSVVERLQERGFEALFAGGCVRDKLLQVPSKDFDVATSAEPKDVKEIFPRTVPVGEAFNVMLVLSDHEKDPIRVEVATFRKDQASLDGRRPESIEPAS